MFGFYFYKKFRLWNITKEFEQKVNYLYGDTENYKHGKINYLGIIRKRYGVLTLASVALDEKMKEVENKRAENFLCGNIHDSPEYMR